MELVLFEKLPNIKLSRSVFRITTFFFQFESTYSSSNTLLQYTLDLEENVQSLYTQLVRDTNQKAYDAPKRNLTYTSLLTSFSNSPALLNPLDLMSLFTKLETKLVSHPRLTLPAWHGENIWHMYKIMKL